MKELFAGGSDHWIKTVGLYIIVILALLRFLIYPLQGAVRDRRAVFADQQETYLLKSRLLQQVREASQGGGAQDREKLRSTLYPRDARVSDIQTDILATLSKYSEGKGMAVLGFEMPEAVAGKRITEVPVVLRLMGSAESFIELLKSIPDNKKALAVKALDISVSGQNMTYVVTVIAYRMET